MSSRRVAIVVTCVAALATFAVVQDRVTAAGARRYAALSRLPAMNDLRPSIENVMAPAIRESVQWGTASAGAVLVVGLAVAFRLRG